MNLARIENLPKEIKILIWEKISLSQKIFIKKEYYLKYNSVIELLIAKNKYQSYLRDIIRCDFSFVFKKVLERKFKYWSLITKSFLYKTIHYPSYIQYIYSLCQAYNSIKCLNILNVFLSLSGFKKDWRKNISNKYYQWIF